VIDPVSVAAVTGFLRAVGSGMASESGQRLGEAVGGMVARVAGREVVAPAGPGGWEPVARELVARARQDPDRARELASSMSGLPAGAVAGQGPAPRLLPSSVRFFTDRTEPLARLGREASRTWDGRPRVAVLYGPEGIGTSALAVHFGALEAHRYPDGALYADGRGASASTAPAAAALLRHFLLKLHVPAEHIPPATEDRADLFRTLLDGRRLLVVLDHARSAAQVAPLITGAPGVFTVVVARRPLTGLDAVAIAVGPLADKDARRLLTELVGKQAVVAARATLPAVLERCGGSPFALRAMAPYLTAPHLADPDLTGPHRTARAPGPAGDGDPVRAAVEDLYRQLPPDAARLYRLAALRGWPDLTAAPVAAAAQVGVDEAERLLAELADLRLVEVTPDGRYRYRPAVRAHAAEAAAREDGLAACAAAVARTVEWFVRFAVQADFAALKERWHLGPLFDALGPGAYENEGAAIAALVAELGGLVESVLAAEEFGDFATACQGAEALWAVQLKAGRHEAVLPALRAGVRAAEQHCPGTRMAGRMHTQLAFALMELPGCHEEAQDELVAAAAAEAQAGHRRGQATALESLGLLRLRQWRFADAFDRFEQAGRLLDGIGPADPGFADLPRARALLERHRGRALRGLGRFGPARSRLDTALAFFRDPATAEPYNEARVLTDLAETERAAGEYAAALRLIDQAAPLLARQNAAVHLDYLDVLRRQCLAGQA
jgi:hypothetical protein